MGKKMNQSLSVELCFVSTLPGYYFLTTENFHQSQKENGEVAELVMAPG